MVLRLAHYHILELPLLGEGVIIGVEFELIGLEADFIEEGIESLEVHLVNVFLFNALSEDGLVCETYRPAPLR